MPSCPIISARAYSPVARVSVGVSLTQPPVMVVTVAATKRSSVFIFPVTAILTATATRLPPLASTRIILKRSLLLGAGGGGPLLAGCAVAVAGAPSFAFASILILI